MKGRYLLIVLTVVLLAGCHKRPFNLFRGEQKDTTELMDIFAIQRKALEAENEVIAVVKADSAYQWVQHEYGWWYRYSHKSDEHVELYNYVAKKDTCCVIHESVYTFSGALLLDAVREYNPHDGGPLSYQFMLREMTPGDTVFMLIPWNLAYGTNGTTFIPPYTNICSRLTIHTNPCADIEIIEDTVANK